MAWRPLNKGKHTTPWQALRDLYSEVPLSDKTPIPGNEPKGILKRNATDETGSQGRCESERHC